MGGAAEYLYNCDVVLYTSGGGRETKLGAVVANQRNEMVVRELVTWCNIDDDMDLESIEFLEDESDGGIELVSLLL